MRSDRRARLVTLAVSAAAVFALGIPTAAFAGPEASHSCAVIPSGKVNCWGNNFSGQLGNNTTNDSWTPVEVAGLTNVSQVRAGQNHSCAVLTTGKVFCWGANAKGQLGDGSTVASLVPVEVSGITNAVQVDLGKYSTCAVLSSGKVNCWGYNWNGQLGNDSSDDSSTPVEVSGITDAVKIGLGRYHACAVLSSGKVNCWGSNVSGQLGNNSSTVTFRTPVEVSGITDAVDVSAGRFHSCAVLSSGKVDCWGSNSDGQVGNNANGASSSVPLEVAGITNAATVSLGRSHSCAVLSTGGVSCWGDGWYGELGNDSTDDSSTPVAVSGITNALKVSSGGTHSCAVLATGKASCWGDNWSGQLGNNSNSGSLVPVNVLDWWAPDTTAPATPGSFTGVPSSPTNQTGATIGFTLGESNGTVECRVDSGSWSACSSVSGTTGSMSLSGLADGSHALAVRQTDAAGNVSEVGTTSSWTVDTVAPAAPLLTGAPSGSTTSTSASISFTGEAGASFTCSVDGGAFADCTSPQSLSGLTLGAHSFAVKVTDAAGNTSDAGSASWIVSAPPVLSPTVLTPSAGTKTVVKAVIGGKSTWVMKLGLLFSTGGDTRGAAQFLTVQVAVDGSGKPVSAKPSDSQSLPTAATFTQGVVAWDASGETKRTTGDAPVWVRVGNRAGKWSGWVKLTQ